VKGYGVLRHPENIRRAHRASYQIHFGSFPLKLKVLHRCDTPLCVNPGHLFLGTQLENIQDRHRKGRTVRGERSGKARLNDQIVREIRALYASGMNCMEIAKRFSFSYRTIASAAKGESWKHVA